MTKKLWRFDASDTLFFRESRPFDAIGGAQLQSTFPPPIRTLIGAVRTSIGEANRVDWNRFQDGEEYQNLREVIGNAQHFGDLSFRGPFLFRDKKRLYPTPLILLQKADSKKYFLLKPAADEDATECDLGNVRLPQLPKDAAGAKPLDDCWITESGLQKVLLGQLPDEKEIVQSKCLFVEEERLGIARNNKTRANVEKALYQVRHIRPHPCVSVGLEVDGITEDILPKDFKDGVCRLGGEGRMASFTLKELNAPIEIPVQSGVKVLLMLATDADFDESWIFPQFNKRQNNGVDEWQGTLNGVALKVISAVVGKPVRQGGWDIAGGKSRELRSLVSAGSCYFCEVEHGNAADAVQKLQGSHVGRENELGRGELIVGYW